MYIYLHMCSAVLGKPYQSTVISNNNNNNNNYKQNQYVTEVSDVTIVPLQRTCISSQLLGIDLDRSCERPDCSTVHA